MNSLVFSYLLDLIHSLNSRLAAVETASPNWEANRFDTLLDNVIKEFEKSNK